MKNILVCTDGSGYSTQACLYAAWLNQQTKASISVLYVTDLRQFEIPTIADFSGSLGIQPFDGMVAQLQEMEEIKSNFVKEQALKTLTDAGVDEAAITFHHETGLLVDVLSDYTDVADLVLMGKRGENASFAKEHLGSMLERVLRSLDKPCLVTNREYKAINRIAIAFDGGANCVKALDYIITNEPFKSMEIHLIVCDEGHDEDRASERLKEAEKRLHAAGLTAKCQLLSGEVETVISDYVQHNHIDLLLLGAYGHSRIREFFIGSTTTELIRRCQVPVFCFR